MTNPLHSGYYADQAIQQTVEIVENVRLAKDTYRIRFDAPVLARRIVPGQFLMLRLAGVNDPLIGRPLALFDTVLSASGEPVGVDVVYLVKGKLTSRLWPMQPGQQLDVWGPLGNGFGQESGVRSQGTGDRGQGTGHSPLTAHHTRDHLVMVAGGIGYTPFFALAQEALGCKNYGDPPRTVAAAERVTLCYGARSAEYLASVEDFQRLGIGVRLATDDGTRGHHGFATDLLQEIVSGQAGSRPRIVCCGPEPMMAAVARIALPAGIPCQVSLETPMACGVGICFTCVAKVRESGGGWDYKRTCVEGPVFDAEMIEW